MKTKLIRPAPRSTSKATAVPAVASKRGHKLNPETVRKINGYVAAAETVLTEELVGALGYVQDSHLLSCNVRPEYFAMHMRAMLAHLIRAELAPPREEVLARLGAGASGITMAWVQFLGGCGLRIENARQHQFIFGPIGLEQLTESLDDHKPVRTSVVTGEPRGHVVEARDTKRAWWSEDASTHALAFKCELTSDEDKFAWEQASETEFTVAVDAIPAFKAAVLTAREHSIAYHKQIGLGYRYTTFRGVETFGLSYRPLELPDGVRVRIHQRHDR